MPRSFRSSLLAHIDAAVPEMLRDIEALVRCESPSDDLAAISRSTGVLTAIGTRRLSVEPERIEVGGCSHLLWRFGLGPTRVLLLGHHDTVWPHGSLDTHPFQIQDGVLRGPGCFDMKAGLVMALYAAATARNTDGLALLVTGDEEIGSPNSRELIEAEAAGCVATLVLEAAGPGGALKTERKGVSQYRVHAHGRAAHAGLEPEKGVNATIELARQVLAVATLGDPVRGTTVTPTVSTSGTVGNTVPASGQFAVDARVRTAAEQRRVDCAMHSLTPWTAGAQVTVHGGPNRPPLEASASTGLYRQTARLAASMGLAVPDAMAVGGASDGNFTAGLGIPTLDGLGAVGGGAHADDEHVLVHELAPRTALLAALINELLARPPSAGTIPTSLSRSRRR